MNREDKRQYFKRNHKREKLGAWLEFNKPLTEPVSQGETSVSTHIWGNSVTQ